uniref:Pyridoxal phosphate homeostasis protein n=2 Tax=Lutzomyia longipalpis TaxID=7200 RepID=A0A7G3AQK8_LUTLO
MSEVDIKQNLKLVVEKIEEAFRKRSPSLQTEKPYLVAVSKTKPAELVVEAYSAGQRHFGENYVQELVEKSHNPELLEKCKEIKWHFIGHLQSNKVNKVLAVPGLYMIETVDSVNLATAINKAWEKFRKEETENLKVLVQVNTSAEDVKSGIDPKEAINLYKFIKDQCPNLHVEGIMTIGKFGHDYSTGPNEDFIALMQCYDEIVRELQLNPRELHVSMGMSNDYEHAIAAGSTIVRVGTSIFGARTPKSDAK